MNYELKIAGDEQDNGMIELERLSQLISATRDIAQKALMLELFGYSDLKVPAQLKKATNIKLRALSGNEQDGTILQLECDNFANNMEYFQSDIFRPSLWEDMQRLTPVALVMRSFETALVADSGPGNLDKPLLKSLLQFRKIFSNSDEIISFAGEHSTAKVQLVQEDFKKVELLDESIPDPSKVTVFGRIDEMKYSKSRIVLLTADGPVNVFIKDERLIEPLANFFGKELTIHGMANYKPGGFISYIEIRDFSKPGEKDKYFSKLPNVMNARQQLLFQIKGRRKSNPLSDLIGKWPGEEVLFDILKDLD